MTLKENEPLHGDEGLGKLGSARTAGRRKRASRERFDNAITVAIIEFVKELHEDDVYRLCMGGSIWIDKDAARYGTVDEDSFEVLGDASDSRITTYGEEAGAHCLMDFGGMADAFLFEGDIDGYGNEYDADSNGVLYSEGNGRKALLDCVERALGGDLDNLWVVGLDN